MAEEKRTLSLRRSEFGRVTRTHRPVRLFFARMLSATSPVTKAPLSLPLSCMLRCGLCQVIGVGGSVIKSIRTESGASVEIQRQELTPLSAENREIYLTGKPECVQLAEKLIWCALPSPRLAAGRSLRWAPTAAAATQNTLRSFHRCRAA